MKCKRRLCFKRYSEECYNLHMAQDTYNCPVKDSIAHVAIPMGVGITSLITGCLIEHKLVIWIGVSLFMLGFILGLIWSFREDFYAY